MTSIHATVEGGRIALPRRTLRTLLSTVTALLGLAAGASAQSPAPAAVVAPAVAHVGDRVRLTTTFIPKPLVGVLVAVRADSVFLRAEDCSTCTPVGLQQQRITAVDLSTRPGAPVVGGVLGFLGGAALGLGGFALWAQHDMRVHPCHGGPCGIGYLYGLPIVGFTTAILGAAVGVNMFSDVWRPATLSMAP